MELFTLPEEKLNDLAQKVSTTLYERHFFNQGRISGDELKKFAQHEQVNRFLIFQVFQVWEMQLNKLYHPYFDLEHEDIDQTIKTLKNQISRHITISQDDFQPMLKRAVYNNLKLLLSPNETFESFFFAQSEKIKLNVYERYSQFYSDLDFVVNSILKYHQKNSLEYVEKETFFQKMDKVVDVFNRKSGQTFEAYRKEKFRALTGKEMSEVIDAARAEQEAIEAAKRQEQEAVRQQQEAEARKKEEEARRKAEEEAMRRAEEEKKRQSFFDTLSSNSNSVFDLDEDTEESTPVAPVTQPQKEEPAFEPPKPEPKEEPVAKEEPKTEPREEKKEEPVTPTPPPVETPKQTPADFLDDYFNERQKKKEQEKQEEPKAEEPVQEAPKPKPEPPVEPKEEKPASILDRISEKPQTVADRFASRKPLNEKLNGSQKIKLDEIPIHKQYQYVQKVFEGNNVRFRIIVDKVNNAQNREEIEDILSKFVLNNDSLDKDDSIVQEFLQLLRNRF